MNDPMDNNGRDYHGNPHPALFPLSKDRTTARKQIARDVLASLRSKRFIAKNLTYLGAERSSNAEQDAYKAQFDGKHDGDAWRPPPTCSVCAIGAAFVAAVDHYNVAVGEVTTGRTDGYLGIGGGLDVERMLTFLNQWFTTLELRLIETIFEGAYQGTGLEELDGEVDEDWLDDVIEEARGLHSAIYELFDVNEQLCHNFTFPELVMTFVMEDIAEYGSVSIARISELVNTWQLDTCLSSRRQACC